MIYLDGVAIVKLVRAETHSADLVEWINARPTVPLVASAVVEVELPRALRPPAPEALTGLPSVLARLYRVEIDAGVRAAAGTYREPNLRSLDAVRLATAQLVGAGGGAQLEAFVTYDDRLLAAAETLGLPTASPRS
jgi:uncharacterized protein